MQEQGREYYQSRVAKKRDRQIEISVRAERRVEMKDKCSQAQPGEVRHERRAPALLENYEQADEEIDDADQVDVKIARRQIVNRAQVVEVGVIVTSLRRIRRPFDQVMNLATDTRLIEIQLNFFSAGNLIAPGSSISVFTFVARHAYGEQVITRNHSRSDCG